MRDKASNDSMSPRQAMTLQSGRGRAPAAAARPLAFSAVPHFIQNFTLIRLCLQYLRVISHLYHNVDTRVPRVRANFNFSKRPLVKLKAAVNNVFSFRTRTLYGVKSVLVKAVVQLFVVAKCVVCKVGRWCRGARGARGARCGQLALVLWLGALGGPSEGRRDNDLHIGGIFPMEGEGGWQGGQACKPAAELALADVNARSDLLSGFKLMLHSNDSKVILIYCTFDFITLRKPSYYPRGLPFADYYPPNMTI